MENPVIAALSRRVRTSGGAPLLTWYRTADSARTELSVKTFANWVDKTANLLETLGAEGPVLGLVSRDHPGHWMSLVWPLACWQAGTGYVVLPDHPDADLQVSGPGAAVPPPGRMAIACSLHPLGLGLRDLPAGVLDFTSEALAEPDAHQVRPAEPDQPAWSDSDGELGWADLAVPAPRTRRALVNAHGARQVLFEGLIPAILGGGSIVLVEGDATPADLERIAAAEHAQILA